MPSGKQIRIYLADGTVAGIRHGEIVNWTGQAISCPRTRFVNFREWPESRRPGVYFLLGIDEDTGQEAVYVGEAEVVLDRLTSHVGDKDFWNELVAFTSKDDHLTKAHVKYLESRLIELVGKAGRFELKNAKVPQLPSLPRGDRDAMEDFIESIRILLGVLGYRALEPLTYAANLPARSEGKRASPIVAGGSGTGFYLKIGPISASAVRTDEGIVVLAGSDATKEIAASLSVGSRTRREELIAAGVLQPNGDKMRFQRDHLFSSPSQAAGIVVGYSINGRDAWRTQDGRTWGSLEDAADSQ